MQEFNAEEVRFETVSAIGILRQAETCIGYPAYIGLDVHKETIAVAVARELAGFIWDIACHEMPKIQQQASR